MMKKLPKVLCCVFIAAILPAANSWSAAPVVDESSSYEEQNAGANTEAAPQAPVLESNSNSDATHESFSADNAADVKEVDVQDSTSNSQSAPSYSNDSDSSSLNDTAHLSVDSRVRRLEQQTNNIVGMNLPQQITILQQQVAQLRGELQEERHNVELLNQQLTNFYKDLNSRISENKGATPPPPQPTAALTPPAPAATGTTSNDEAAAANAPPVNAQLQDANAYQTAFSLLTNRKYDQSQQSFSSYVSRFPQGKYIADAHYWLGEIYLLKKNPPQAEKEFQTVINQFPQSPKVSDAKFKLAIIHANEGKLAQAKSELVEIKKKNPNSTAAQLANIRLQQLEQGTTAQ